MPYDTPFELTLRARELRLNQTPAEKKLWEHLRNRRLGGHRFNRQAVIGPFIVDFVCKAEKLVVEVDGDDHVDKAASDARRTAFLNARGYRVARFWNAEVHEDAEGVSARVLAVIEG